MIRAQGSNEIRDGVYIVRSVDVGCFGGSNQASATALVGLPGPYVSYRAFRVIPEVR